MTQACSHRDNESNPTSGRTIDRLKDSVSVGDWKAIEKTFSHADPHVFAEVWEESPSADFRGTEVRVLWEPDGLWIYSVLQDDDIYNAAEKLNDYTWEKGDIFEIFVVTPESERYLELHVTPQNSHTQIIWPNFQSIIELREKALPIEDYMTSEPLFSSWTKLEKGYWRVLANVRAGAIVNGGALVKGMGLKMSFARYDTNRENDRIIFSSNSPHKKINYHIQGDWSEFKLVD